MPTLSITLLAQADLDGILNYIAQDRPLAAENVVKEIRGTCERLTSFPRLGHARPEIHDNCRCTTVGRYVIYYRYAQATDEVQIVRIVDGARDIDEVFFSD